jgi:hypothetical protein
MALTPLTDRQKTLIVANVVRACKDIQALNKGTGYNFLYQCSGFIAHYDLYGFIEAYREPGKLRRDILDFARQNQWSNFRPGERDYEYMMAKKDVYNRIVAQICVP